MIISTKDKTWKIFLPTEEDVIRQRMIYLLSTYFHSAILNREFGVEHPIDSKNIYENAKLKNKIITQAKEFVPEFKIDWIEIKDDNEGSVEVRVGGEVDLDRGFD